MNRLLEQLLDVLGGVLWRIVLFSSLTVAWFYWALWVFAQLIRP